jgi:hypothetical protein
LDRPALHGGCPGNLTFQFTIWLHNIEWLNYFSKGGIYMGAAGPGVGGCGAGWGSFGLVFILFLILILLLVGIN